MARGKVVGGTGYIPSADLREMAEKESLVMWRKHRQVADFKGENGPTACVLVDIAVLTGPFAGRVVMGTEQIGNGLTNELVRQADGADLPTKLVLRKRSGREYAAITAPSETELAKIDETFPPGKEDEVWESLRGKAEAQQAERTEDAPGSGANAGDASGDGDDEPPW